MTPRIDIKNEGVLILAPHCDDIPLSLGACLTCGLLGSYVQVIVVFTLSCYTRFQLGTADLGETTAMRISEELRAARIANYSVKFLPFPEPFARPGFKNLEDICNPKRNPKDEEIWPIVYKSLMHLMQSHRGPILGPLGCGNHIDHRIVSVCLREYSEISSEIFPAFYEDLPYAAKLSNIEIKFLLPTSNPKTPFVQIDLKGGSIEKKLNLLTIYKSQLGYEDILIIKKHWDINKSERLWIKSSWNFKHFQKSDVKCINQMFQ